MEFSFFLVYGTMLLLYPQDFMQQLCFPREKKVPAVRELQCQELTENIYQRNIIQFCPSRARIVSTLQRHYGNKKKRNDRTF
jgi:hypothetical protein